MTYYSWLDRVRSQPLVPICPTLSKDGIAVIIYTAGTTGAPKGVELSHHNLCACTKAIREVSLVTFLMHHVSVPFLPWAHIFGQTNELNTMMLAGNSMALLPHRDQLLECLDLVKPTVLVSVPALYNRIYDGVMLNISKQSPVIQYLFKQAFHTARQRNHAKEYGLPLSGWTEWQYQAWNKLLLSKIKNKIGVNLK